MVVKYLAGGAFCIAFLIFCIKQFKSVIDAVRKHRETKSSEEVKKDNTALISSSEESEKEVDKV